MKRLSLLHACRSLLALMSLSLSCGPLLAESAPAFQAPTGTAVSLLVGGRISNADTWCLQWPLVLTTRGAPGASDSCRLVVLRNERSETWPWRRVADPSWNGRVAFVLAAGELALQPQGPCRFELREGEHVLASLDLDLVAAPDKPDDDFVRQGLFARQVWAETVNDAVAMAAVAADSLRLQPGDIDSQILRGDALVKAGKDEEAALAYEKAMELYGKSIDPPQFIIARLDAVNRRLLAAGQTVPLPKQSPAEERFIQGCADGDKAFRKGRYDEAVRFYDRALKTLRDAKLAISDSLVQEKLVSAREQAAKAAAEKLRKQQEEKERRAKLQEEKERKAKAKAEKELKP